MTVFAKPWPWGFFISYIIYNWPEWSHVFGTYIHSSQEVKEYIYLLKNIQTNHAFIASSFPFHLIKLLSNWKKKAQGSPQDTLNQIWGLSTATCLYEEIHLSPAFLFATSKRLLGEKKKRLREKCHQTIL